MSDIVQIEIFAEAWADWHIKHHNITPSERKAFVEGYIEGAKHILNDIRP